MTIEAKLDQTNELLRALLGKFEHIGTAETAAPKPAAQAPAQKPAAQTPPPPAQKPAEKPTAVGYDDVRKAGLALATAKPGDALHKLLATFGVDHANKLKPEQYADFIKKATDEAGKK